MATVQMSLQELFAGELRDLYSSESQLVKALPKMVKAAKSKELKQALETHLAETEQQLERVKQALKLVGEKAAGELCKGMQGIVAEGEENIKKNAGDLALIGAGERVEHYEMAAYESAIAMAKELGLSEAEELLSESLLEEEKAAQLLSKLSKPMLSELGKTASAPVRR